MMKKIILRILALVSVIAMLFAFGCDNVSDTNEETSSLTEALQSTSETKKERETMSDIIDKSTVDLYNEDDVLENADYRILLTSDVHYTYLSTWGGISQRERMQLWVDTVKLEHAKRPFDLIAIVGDVSLDFWDQKYGPGGSYLGEGVCTTKTFIDDYVSQLPQDVPVFVLAGNHEQYGNAKWKELTGNDRQGSFVLGDNLFLFLDSFAGDLDPTKHHDGVPSAPDIDFINREIAKYPKHNVYLISHDFDLAKGGAQFQNIVKQQRIIALFKGHTHKAIVENLGANYGHKQLAHTGHFSEKHDDTNWGFRDLVIVGNRSVSRYIVAEANASFSSGTMTKIDREIKEVVTFKTK